MQIDKIYHTDKFEKQYRTLPLHVQELAEEKEKIFRNGTSDFRLKTHKLHGSEMPAWAFWINRAYRVKFLFRPDGSALFLEIGTHDIYR